MHQNIEAVEVETAEGARVVPSVPARSRRLLRWSPISLALAASAAILAGYAAFERLGTVANADTIEFTTNYAGGFLAVGTTDDDPGFIVLSKIDQDQINVSAMQSGSLAAGTHTIVEVTTARHRWQKRLRGPQIILISGDGSIDGRDVDWTFEDFQRIRSAADCSHERATGKHRCGAPFADLHDLVSSGRLRNVPENVRTFLERFADRD